LITLPTNNKEDIEIALFKLEKRIEKLKSQGGDGAGRAVVIGKQSGVGPQGPPGPAGPQGETGPVGGVDQVFIEGLADEAIGGQRATITHSSGRFRTATHTDVNHAGNFAGITRAAVPGQGYTVQTVLSGYMEETSWSWTPGKPIFLGLDGVLTQLVPTSGFVQILGTAFDAQSMFVLPYDSTIL
jgi:hypothetical protein